METGIVTEERVVPGRQSSLYLCLHTFEIYFQTVMCFVVCRPKTLLEFKDFLYFIFKSLCAFVSCR